MSSSVWWASTGDDDDDDVDWGFIVLHFTALDIQG